MRTPILFMLLLSPLVAAQAEEGYISLDTSCRHAELVVVGTLGDLKPFSRGEAGNEIDGVEAHIAVKEVLLGRSPGADLPILWENPRGLGCPRTEHSGRVGQELIWILTQDQKGIWHAHSGQLVKLLEERPAVEKAIQARLAPALKVLETSDSVWGEGKFTVTPAEWGACDALAKAGPAALPAVRRLLAAPSPVQRGWGCRVAELLKDKALALDLGAILEDPAPLTIHQCELIHTAVGRRALEALGAVAGRAFADTAEGRAWCDQQGAVPEPASPAAWQARFIRLTPGMSRTDAEHEIETVRKVKSLYDMWAMDTSATVAYRLDPETILLVTYRPGIPGCRTIEGVCLPPQKDGKLVDYAVLPLK